MLIRRTHELRYVLKNKEIGDVYFVVVFTMLLREDVEKQEAEEAQRTSRPSASEGKAGHQDPETFQPSADDLD